MSDDKQLDRFVEEYEEEQRLCNIANALLGILTAWKPTVQESLQILKKVKEAVKTSAHSATWGDHLTCGLAQNQSKSRRIEGVVEEYNRRKELKNEEENRIRNKPMFEQVPHKETREVLRDFIDRYRRKIKPGRTLELPLTFRGIIQGSNKEIIFEANEYWSEYYITIQDECASLPLSLSDGQELLCAIAEHIKPLVKRSDMIWSEVEHE